MRRIIIPPFTAGRTAQYGPAVMVVGLAVLIVVTWSPVVPVITPLALVALGTTATTVARLHGAAAVRPLIALHLFVYTSLYLLFIGAVCHASMAGPRDGLTILQGLDFGASVAPMAYAVRMCLAAMAGGGDAPAR